MRLLALIAASLLSACGRSGARVSAGAFEGLGFRTALIVISPNVKTR